MNGTVQHPLFMNTGQKYFYGKGDRAVDFPCNNSIRDEQIYLQEFSFSTGHVMINFALSLKKDTRSPSTDHEKA